MRFRWDSSPVGALFTRLKAFSLLRILRVKAFYFHRILRVKTFYFQTILRVKAFYLNDGVGTRAASILRVPRNRDSTLSNIVDDVLCEFEQNHWYTSISMSI